MTTFLSHTSLGVSRRFYRAVMMLFFMLCVVFLYFSFIQKSTAADKYINVDLSWIEPADNGGSNGIKKISYYEIRYADVEITQDNFNDSSITSIYTYNPDDEMWTPRFPGEEHSVTLVGIPISTKSIGIKACDEADNCSTITLFKLNISPPDSITDLKISETFSNGFTLSFTAIDRERFPTAALEIRYMKNTTQITEENFDNATQYVLDGERSEEIELGKVTLSGLEEDSLYAIAIKVVDAIGSSEISNSVSGTTRDETAPGAIENLSISAISEKSITLSWIVPSDNGDSTGTKAITSYIINYSDQTITDITPLEPGQTQTVTIDGLSPETTSVSIRACDEVPLCSPESNIKFSLAKPTIPAADPPTVNSPIYERDSSISGSSNTSKDAIITIFVNNEPIGDTDLSNGIWTFSLPNPDLLIQGDEVSATATIDTNQDGIIDSADTPSDKSNIVSVMRPIEIDSTPPGIVKITDLNFTLLEDLGQTYEVTIDIQGNNITEPLQYLDVCIAPVQNGSLAVNESKEFYFLPTESSPEDVWSRSITTTLSSETIWIWTHAVDLSSNTAGTSCSSTPQDNEGIIITWLSGGGKNYYYYIVSDTTDTTTTVEKVNEPSAIQKEISECSDSVDNDNDGAIDYPEDSGCESSDGASESEIGGILEPLTENDKTEDVQEIVESTPESLAVQENNFSAPAPPSISDIKITNIVPKDENMFVVDMTISGTRAKNSSYIGIHAESEPFEIRFMPDNDSEKWEYKTQVSFEAGDHLVYAWAEDDAGNRSENSEIVYFSITADGKVHIPPLAEEPKNIAEEVFSIISDQNENPSHTAIGKAVQVIVDNPTAEEAVQTIIPPVIATVVVANTAAATTGFNILAYFQYLFTSPILLIARRKRKKWGVVYNSLTKKPIDLAIVRLFDRETNKLIKTQVTDQEGRYHFIVPKGKYYITITKPEFIFPTSYLEFKNSDVNYLDLYHGDTINITSEGESIALNIPLDPKEKKAESFSELLSHRFFRRSQSVLAFSGVFLAFVSFLISPVPILLGLLALHILLYMLFRKFSTRKKPKSWGTIYDKNTKKPIKNAIVRIFDTEFHRLLETQLTDNLGRYAFLVGNNMYYVRAEKKGYNDKTSDQIDLRKKGTENIVKLDIGLEPSSLEQ